MQDLLQEKDEEIARLSRAERKNHEELVESLRANIHAWYKEREEKQEAYLGRNPKQENEEETCTNQR